MTPFSLKVANPIFMLTDIPMAIMAGLFVPVDQQLSRHPKRHRSMWS
jgi:hypothetical protein